MGGKSPWENICCHFATFRDCISFSMQHDHVLEKLHFDQLTSSPRVVCVCVGGGESMGKIYATMFLHLRIPLI